MKYVITIEEYWYNKKSDNSSPRVIGPFSTKEKAEKYLRRCSVRNGVNCSKTYDNIVPLEGSREYRKKR